MNRNLQNRRQIWSIHIQSKMGHMQVCTLLQTDNHASTPPLSFLQAGCPSCRPTNSVKALKAYALWSFLMVLALAACSTIVAVRWRDHQAEAASRHHVPVGIPAPAAAELRLLSELHPLGRPRARHLQADQLEGRLASLGYPQEQAGHELRDDGPSAEVSCTACLHLVLSGHIRTYTPV